MNNLKCAAKLIGLTVLAFGVGLLASFFFAGRLPCRDRGGCYHRHRIFIFLHQIEAREWLMRIITVKSPRALRALLRRIFRIR